MVKESAKQAEQQPDFEAALEELETLVEAMETGDISLEESLAKFERGIALTRQCQQVLKQAEQKVQILMQENADPEPFEPASVATTATDNE